MPEWNHLSGDLPLLADGYEHLGTARVECVKPGSILVMRREKGGWSKQTMSSSDCKTFFCSLLPSPKHKPALKSDAGDGSFLNISFFLWLAFIPDIFKMCFNLEKDKTEALQESKWSLKPRALYINNVVSLEKKRKKKGKKPTSSKQKPKAWPFSYFQVKSRGQHTVYLSIYIPYRQLQRIFPEIFPLLIWKSKCAIIADRWQQECPYASTLYGSVL